MRTKVLSVVYVSLVLTGSVLIRLRPDRPNKSVRARSGATALFRPSVAGASGNLPEASKQRIVASFARLPLSFEPNRGQTDARVKFLSRGHGYTLFLTGDEAFLALQRTEDKSKIKNHKAKIKNEGLENRNSKTKIETRQSQIGKPKSKIKLAPAVLRMKLVGANPAPQVEGLDELPGKSNYFRGNDPSKWRSNVSQYAKVRYRNVYPGVDVVYYGNQGQVEHDFIVAPGADPSAIRLGFEGAEKLSIDAQGALVLASKEGEVHLQKPVIYQEVEGVRKEIRGGYRLKGSNQVGFELGEYDSAKPLIIDPALVYSTYLGGSNGEIGKGIAVDAAGNAYVTGRTSSTDFPTTPGAFQTTFGGFDDAFVTKLNPEGSELVYSTYLGGSDEDAALAIAVDSSGNAYVTGETFSTNFPTTPDAFQTTLGGASDAFVTKLNLAGSDLVYSTYLGGTRNDSGEAIGVDSTGNAYVAGETISADFPTTPDAFQTTFSDTPFFDAFVTKLNLADSDLVYSTYLGGSLNDVASGIAVDSSGNAYVTGETRSTDFPTTPEALQTTLGGASDAFVTKLDPTGSGLLYSTYLGGSAGDRSFAIAVDTTGNTYVTGDTRSTDFPTTTDAFQTALGGASDAFVTKLNPTGSSLVYSTYLGGAFNDSGKAIAVDSASNAYVTGETSSSNFPTTPDAFQTDFGGVADAFVTKLNAAGSDLVYSTYLGGSGSDRGGGIAVDGAGNAYVTGETFSTNFPTTPGAFQTTFGGFADAFVAKINGAAVQSLPK